MTGLELRDLLWQMKDEDLQKQFVVFHEYSRRVYTDIQPHDIIVTKADEDYNGDTYPDCIMLGVG